MANDVKVLVVDDNDGDLFLFKESITVVQDFLSDKDIIIDFDIQTAIDGTEATKILETESFDIIFLDIKMPKMDGIECLEKIRDGNTPYIVMFTTSDYEEDIKKTHKLGANGYLLKSLDIMEFEENLKSILLLFIQDNFVYFQTVNPKYKNFLE